MHKVGTIIRTPGQHKPTNASIIRVFWGLNVYSLCISR